MTTEGSEPQVEVTPAAPPRKLNVFERIAGVLFAPAETFQEVVRRPDFVAPILFFVAFGYLSTFLMAPRIDFDAVKEAQAAQFKKRGMKMSESDLDRVERMGIATIKVGMWVNPVLMILVYAVIAGVVFFGFRLMGGEGTFTQALTVTLYAWIPMLLLSIIGAIVVLARGSFDPMTAATLVKSNPSFLIDQKAQPVLYALCSSLDLFSFWTIWLFILGFGTLSRLSRGTSAAIVLTFWVVMVLLKLGYVAVTA